MKKYSLLSILGSTFVGGSLLAFAQSGALRSVDSLFGTMVQYVLTPLYSLAVGISVAWFLFWVAIYTFKLDEEETRNKAKRHLLFGLLGLFIIFSIGAIFGLFEQLFGSVL
jgi:hypothetical protein